MEDIVFLGNSLDDPREFPASVHGKAGYQLDRVQNGLEPHDSKPMPTIGKGVWEIRLKDEAGQFRVIYVAKPKDAIYVLHCFQKKTQKTTTQDLSISTKRLRELLQGLKS
ncbi:MAG: type II toxin-antitoxin system RelE/ParE family toxin [Limnohabitans sp.]|nr:type II toxin-antitoxin system RelE/ParE family toxin [Limnohabitans sp.]